MDKKGKNKGKKDNGKKDKRKNGNAGIWPQRIENGGEPASD